MAGNDREVLNISETIVSHYEDKLKRHRGNIALEVDWDSDTNLLIRYNKIKELIPPGTTTLLDYGCGTASLYPHVKSEVFSYYGCDASEEMIAEAGKRYIAQAQKENNFFNVWKADIHKEDWSGYLFDTVCANGVFTEKLDTPQHKMIDYLEETLTKLLSITGKALIFNVMNPYAVDWERDDLFFMSFNQMATVLRNCAVSKYKFDCSYGLREYMVVINK